MGNGVLIRITSQKTGDNYLAKSYPDNDYNNDGWGELYSVPVYYLEIINIDDPAVSYRWKCLRFMPYWNDPSSPSSNYKLRGWTVAGLSDRKERTQVTYYDSTYGTRNRFHPIEVQFKSKIVFLSIVVLLLWMIMVGEVRDV